MPARHGKPWTVNEMLTLAELYAQPITWHTIAHRMERSISACMARLHLIRLACALQPTLNANTILQSVATTRVQPTIPDNAPTKAEKHIKLVKEFKKHLGNEDA